MKRVNDIYLDIDRRNIRDLTIVAAKEQESIDQQVYNNIDESNNILESIDLISILKNRLRLDEKTLIESLKRLVDSKRVFEAKSAKDGKKYLLK